MASSYPSNAQRAAPAIRPSISPANDNFRSLPATRATPANDNFRRVVRDTRQLLKLVRKFNPYQLGVEALYAVMNSPVRATNSAHAIPGGPPIGYTVSQTRAGHTPIAGFCSNGYNVNMMADGTTSSETDPFSVTSHGGAYGAATGDAHWLAWLAKDRQVGSSSYFYVLQSYHKIHGGVYDSIVIFPRWIPDIVAPPVPVPAVAPQELPIFRPIPGGTPSRVPYPLTPRLPVENPWVSPTPIRGPNVAPRPAPRPRPKPVAYPAPALRPFVGPVPYTAVQIYPGPVKAVAAAGRSKPPANTRERKMIVSAGAVAVAFGMGTEAIDLIDNIYDNISNKPRKRLKVPDKVAYIWRNLDRVDWTGAFNDFLRDQLTDAAIARLSQAANKSVVNSPYYNRPVGIGTGPAL